MDRRHFLITSVAALCAASPVLAASFQDQVIGQLRKQGFAKFKVERTLLGRIRILATRQDGRREIILNPRTGEILRDLWVANGGGDDASGGGLMDPGSDDGSDDDKSDDGGDDDGDDDSDDDNSGSDKDSDNSGSGGGGDDDDD